MVKRTLRRTTAYAIMVALFVVAAIGLGACGGSDNGDGGSSSASGATASGTAASGGADSSIDVPARVKKAGALNIGAFLQYPPYSYLDKAGKPTGIEIQIADALAKKMGVKAQYHGVEYAALFPAIQNGRYDFALGESFKTTEREKVLDVMPWLRTTLAVAVRKGNPGNVDPNDLCTATFGDTSGSANLEADKKIAAQCAKDGKPKPKVVTFQDVATRIQALINGHTTVMLEDPAVLKYMADKQHVPVEVLPDSKLSEDIAKRYPAGWLFKKDDMEMQKAVTQGIDSLIKDGTWGRIMKEGGIGDPIIPPSFAIPAVTI